MTKKATDQTANVMKDQATAIDEIEKAMRSKIEELIPIYKDMPAAQTVTSTQGDQVIKANPAMQEIRATFRDYCTIVKAQKELTDQEQGPAEITSINALRAKLKIAK